MPFPGRSVLLAAALAGAALGAVPALGARHHRARLVAVKARAHGNVPRALPTRPPLTGTLPSPTGTTSTPDTTPTTTTPVASCPTAIGINEWEFHTVPSRTKLCPGKVTWQLDNTGLDDHDLAVVNVDTGTEVASWPVVHPGTQKTLVLTLPAGTYRIFCTLSSNNQSHDSLGMNAVVTVG